MLKLREKLEKEASKMVLLDWGFLCEVIKGEIIMFLKGDVGKGPVNPLFQAQF